MRRSIRRPIKASVNDGMIEFEVIRGGENYKANGSSLSYLDEISVGTVSLPAEILEMDYEDDEYEVDSLLKDAGVFDMLRYYSDTSDIYIDSDGIYIWDNGSPAFDILIGELKRK